MKRILSLFLLLATAVVLRAEKPMTVLVAGENDAVWREHFEVLAAQAPVLSTFTERRFFPYRKKPIELRGEMRFSPEHGLSLRYVEPRERIMIVDDAGVLLRDDRGRSRQVPADSRRPNVGAILLPILGFDFDALLETFEVSVAGEPADWVLRFTPRDPEAAKAIGTVTVAGTDAVVRNIEFRRSKSQRVEIAVEESTPHVDFPADDLGKYFR